VAEIVFRVTALVLAVTFMSVRSVFERRLGRASKSSEMKRANAADRTELVAISVATFAQWGYLLTPWLDFAAIGLPDSVRWAGGAVTLVGIALFWWSHSTLAGNWTPFVEAPPTGELITGGPYRWVRHPMYTAFLVYNTGLFVLTSNWFSLPVLVAFTWMYLHRKPREEALMVEQFGEEYVAYAAGAGAIVPGIGRGVRVP